MDSEENINKISGKVFGALIKAMGKIGAVGKDRANTQQGFKYRGIDDVYNGLHTAMSEAGVFCTPITIERTEEEYQTKNGAMWNHVVLKTIYRFYADDGSHVDVGPIFSEGDDSGDKASMKALAHGHKYALLQMFMIPTEELKDPDEATPPDRDQKRGVKNQTIRNVPKATSVTDKPIEQHSIKKETDVLDKNDPGNFVVKFGTKFKGKRICEIPIEDLKSYYNYYSEIKEKGKPVLGPAADLLSTIELYFTKKESEHAFS